MSHMVIRMEDVSKQYRLGMVGLGTFRGDFERWFARLRGQADPYLKVGEENILDISDGKYVWALKDIHLEVSQGEVLGIIGKNGAGKSTLLKILSRITGPTTGSIKVKGRLASLLEVGTGFHPELSGMENIYLNGAILGMRKAEIRQKLDEIIEFAGIRKYVGTPVKRYSSGMYVRLAFSVAAFLEPEILVVDEVLAVGDINFQRKAIGKMKSVSQNEGRTVLFVSHNMGAVKNLCQRGILLEGGKISFAGTANETVETYIKRQEVYRSMDIEKIEERTGNGQMKITGANLRDGNNNKVSVFQLGESMRIEIYFEKNLPDQEVFSSRIDLMINSSNTDVVTWMSTSIYDENPLINRNTLTFEIQKLMLNQGYYDLTIYSEINGQLSDRIQHVKGFQVSFNDYYQTGKTINSGQCSLVSDFNIS